MTTLDQQLYGSGSSKSSKSDEDNPEDVGSAAWAAAVAKSEKEAQDATGKDAPTETGGGMTSSADSISTAQMDKNAGDTAAPAQTPESAYEELANAQAEQYLQATKNMSALTSGFSIPTTDQNINTGAEAMLGQSSSGPMAQWLNQETAAAAAQYAPTQAANAQVSSAEQQGEALEAKGLQGLGTAETQMLNAAPYDQLLSALASEVPYHLAANYSSEGITIPGLTSGNIPNWLMNAEANVGASPLGTSQSAISAAKGGILPAPNTGTITSPSLTSSDVGGAPQ